MQIKTLVKALNPRQIRKALIKKLDTLFAEKIKARDNYTCRKCGSKTKQLQCAHFYSRKYFALRWDPRNAATLDAGCHMFFHHNPLEFTKWFTEQVGSVTVAALSIKKLNTFKTNESNLRMQLVALKQEEFK